MEKHCVSLEIAKKLGEAGWKKETIFNYYAGETDPNYTPYLDTKNDSCPKRFEFLIAPAPLATELLEELKTPIVIHYDPLVIIVCVDDHIEEGNTLLIALAKMWLYLKKEKLIQC